MKKFFQLFLFLPRFLAILAAYLLRGKKTLTCTLTTEYTFIRYVPVRGRELQPNEGAPRPSCPSRLERKARWRAFPNHSEISDSYGYGNETLQG